MSAHKIPDHPLMHVQMFDCDCGFVCFYQENLKTPRLMACFMPLNRLSSSLDHACAISGIILRTSSHSGDDACNLNTCIALNQLVSVKNKESSTPFKSFFFFFPVSR